jgi:hypothetical protein
MMIGLIEDVILSEAKDLAFKWIRRFFVASLLRMTETVYFSGAGA